MKNRMMCLFCLSAVAVFVLAGFEGHAAKKSGSLEPRAENFIIVLDASASFNDAYDGEKKLDLAKDVIARINGAIPNIPLTGELRTFGKGNPNIAEYFTAKIGEKIPSAIKTETVYGPTDYSREDLGIAIERIAKASGLSHLDAAIDEASRDMESFSGRTAVIIVSDGKLDDRKAFIAADRMKQRFGGNVCIHTVFIPSDTADIQQVAEDKRKLEEIRQAGGCGFSMVMDDLIADADNHMAKVFLGPITETTVKTQTDEKPAVVSTKPVAVQKTKTTDKYSETVGKASAGTKSTIPAPMPLDSDAAFTDTDGDGVSDDRDHCPDSPAGIKVNPYGCWVLGDVLFDTGKAAIRPEAHSELDDVVTVLKKNRGLKVEIQGHTDNFGSPKFNLRLSEKRARAVMDYILKKGIAGDRMTSKGYGRDKPVATNNTPEGRKMNRRVELKPVQ